MSDDLLSRLGQVAREEDEAARAIESEQADASELLRARVLAQATAQLAPKAQPQPKRWQKPALGAALAAAAALLFVWMRPAQDALPTYALSISGGLDETRGPAETGVHRFGERSQLELVMRPADDVRDALELRLWLEHDGKGRRLVADAERSETGTFRLAASAKELLAGQPGRSRLTVFVCRANECEQSEHTLRSHRVLPEGQAAQIEVEYLP